MKVRAFERVTVEGIALDKKIQEITNPKDVNILEKSYWKNRKYEIIPDEVPEERFEDSLRKSTATIGARSTVPSQPAPVEVAGLETINAKRREAKSLGINTKGLNLDEIQAKIDEKYLGESKQTFGGHD